MKYILYIDVQPENYPTALDPRAKEVASAICGFASRVAERGDVHSVATRLALDPDDPPELYPGLAPLVQSRPVRYDPPCRFTGLLARIAQDGGNPDEIVICGFYASTTVIRAALMFRDAYPDAKVTLLEDLCYDPDLDHFGAAMLVAECNGIYTMSAADYLDQLDNPSKDSSDADQHQP